MSNKPHILIDPHPRRMDEIFTPEDRRRLESEAELVWAKDEPISMERFNRDRGTAFAVVTGSWRYGTVHDMPSLHAILEVLGAHPAASALDYELCFARHVRVLSCAPAFAPMVAEMALGMAIDAAREISGGDAAFKNGKERYLHEGNCSTFSLFGATVGFIGYGNLTLALQTLLEPFGCRLLAYDPWLPDFFIKERAVEPVDIETLLTTCRIVFVLAKPTSKNKELLSRRRLELLAPDSILVVISRAHLVDFDALTDLLHQGRFKAAIDVFPNEPLSADHPIRTAPNTILSAHRAGSVKRGLKAIGRMVTDDILTMLAGFPPRRMQRAEPEYVERW